MVHAVVHLLYMYNILFVYVARQLQYSILHFVCLR
jgi:hypothetical protein